MESLAPVPPPGVSPSLGRDPGPHGQIPESERRKIAEAVHAAVAEHFQNPDFLVERYFRYCAQYWNLEARLRELQEETPED